MILFHLEKSVENSFYKFIPVEKEERKHIIR